MPKQLKIAAVHPLHKEELLMQVSKCMANIHSSNNKENLWKIYPQKINVLFS